MKMWIARNQSGALRLFRWTPKYNEKLDMWYEEHFEDGYGNISDFEYPEVTFENSPVEVELVFPSKYAELTNDRLMRIIEKGMIGNEWGILVQEIK